MGFHLAYRPYLPNHLHWSDHSAGDLGVDKTASLGSFGSSSGSWRSSGNFRNAAVSSGCGATLVFCTHFHLDIIYQIVVTHKMFEDKKSPG